MYKIGDKSTVRYHFTPTRVAIIKKQTNKQNDLSRGGGEIGTLMCFWWECEMRQPLWEQSGRSSKAKHRITMYSSNPIPGYIPQRREKRGLEEIFAHPCSQQLDSQQPKGGNTPSVHEQLRDERGVIYPHTGILLSLQKDSGIQ